MARTFTRCIVGNRLAFYDLAPDAAFWAHRWRGLLSPKSYAAALQGKLNFLEKPVTRYLPRTGLILEAGCGMGQVVLALRARGYQAEGVDFAQETVNNVKNLFPDLPIKTGDVTHLEAPDNYYSGYVSLGVMEHRQEGPEPFLEEAYRVLTQDGIALISVPHFHALRRLKVKLGLYSRDVNGSHFYQYAFTQQEFLALLRRHGFRILDTLVYAPTEGFLEEIPGFPYLARHSRPLSLMLTRVVGRLPYVRRYLGHMLMVVAQKA